MNNCYFCGSKLKEEKVNIARYWGEELISLQNVPAIVCKQCGERYFEANVSTEIDKKIKTWLQKKEANTKITVPVLHF